MELTSQEYSVIQAHANVLNDQLRQLSTHTMPTGWSSSCTQVTRDQMEKLVTCILDARKEAEEAARPKAAPNEMALLDPSSIGFKVRYLVQLTEERKYLEKELETNLPRRLEEVSSRAKEVRESILQFLSDRGQDVIFTYKGDSYRVFLEGGVVRVTKGLAV